MATFDLPTAQELSNYDLTDKRFWQEIYLEMLRLKEQREVLVAVRHI